jgi:hypothetical protein
MLTLFVGDNTHELADYANLHGVSVLATNANYKKIIEQSKTKNIVAHTSFSDIGKVTKTESPFYTLLLAADLIEYHPPERWSDHSDTYQLHNMQRITEYYLYDVNLLKKNVTGLTLDHWTKNIKYLQLADTRKTTGQNLWISGCSISHGVGIDPNQRYGQLLADSLQLPVNFLTKGGSGIEWAADQLLRSDIQKNDIVVWGLTSEFRAAEWDSTKHSVKNINPYDFEASESGSLAIVSEENRLYKALIAINQVENFCIKIGVKLILFPLLASESLRLHLSNNRCYNENPYLARFVDIGNDGEHPGPKQHQCWADVIRLHI